METLRNCAFSQNCHTRKLVEITVFYAVMSQKCHEGFRDIALQLCKERFHHRYFPVICAEFSKLRWSTCKELSQRRNLCEKLLNIVLRIFINAMHNEMSSIMILFHIYISLKKPWRSRYRAITLQKFITTEVVVFTKPSV